MKVLFFSTAISYSGGAAICLMNMIDGLIQKGVQPVFLLKGQGSFADELDRRHICYYIVKSYDWALPKTQIKGIKNQIKCIMKQVFNIRANIIIKNILLKEKIELVHYNCLYNGCGAVEAYKLGVPVVWHMREFIGIDDITPCFLNKDKTMDILSKADALIAVSECIRGEYKKYLPEKKMIRIYDGVFVNKFKFKECSITNSLVLGMAGTMPIKGHFDAVNALYYLHQNGFKKSSLRIAGKWYPGDSNIEYRKNLEKYIKDLGLVDYVVFEGHIRDMNSFWNSVDIALSCSYYESFGLVAVEVMLCGVPLICTKTTGLLETSQNGRFCELYNSGNGEELYRKIIYILNNQTYIEDRCKTASEYIKNCFDINCTENELFDLFCRVIENANKNKQKSDF